jgi:branched-chain amino acid aminotransferase
MATESSSLRNPIVGVFLDGEFHAPENAKVSVFDRGFLYGDSVFETIRTYAGKPFALGEHLERLEASAARVHISLPVSSATLAQEVHQAVEHCGHEESYIRVMITRGEGALGLDPALARGPLRVVIISALNLPPSEDYRNGIRAVSYVASRATDDTPAAGAKIGNYLLAVLAHQYAAERGAKEALIVNSRGQVLEGATSNLFWWKSGVLLTPPVSVGILAGITRARVLDVASEEGIAVEMRVPTIGDLLSADGLFVSSSIRELMPVVHLDGVAVAGGMVPAATRGLHAAFRRSVGARFGERDAAL